MTVYAVGDLQGHWSPLQALLERVNFNSDHDELWLVGDLVNKGPESMQCLSEVKALGSSARLVLGNHECKLLAMSEGLPAMGRVEDLEQLLTEPSIGVYLDWLKFQPFLIPQVSGRWVMTHAGIPPQWTMSEAAGYAAQLEESMQGQQWRNWLLARIDDETDRHWSPTGPVQDQLQYTLDAFTRMRFTDSDGTLDFTAKQAAPEGMRPWFDWPQRTAETVVFGHWSDIHGETGHNNRIGLDTGYCSGGQLVLLNLNTGQRESVAAPGNEPT